MTPRTTGLFPELGPHDAISGDKATVIEAAIKAGKFPPSRRAHYAALYDKNPEGTVRLINRLTAVIPPGRSAGTGLLPELD